MLQVEKRRAPDRVGTRAARYYIKKRTKLLSGDQGGLTGDTLPALALLDPGVSEAFAVNVRFAFFRALDAKDSDDHRGVPVDLNIHLFVDRLRRLVGWLFDAGKKFAFGRDAAVVFNGDERIGKDHVQGLGIF